MNSTDLNSIDLNSIDENSWFNNIVIIYEDFLNMDKVYFFTNGVNIKIGYTKSNIEKRLK